MRHQGSERRGLKCSACRVHPCSPLRAPSVAHLYKPFSSVDCALWPDAPRRADRRPAETPDRKVLLSRGRPSSGIASRLFCFPQRPSRLRPVTTAILVKDQDHDKPWRPDARQPPPPARLPSSRAPDGLPLASPNRSLPRLNLWTPPSPTRPTSTTAPTRTKTGIRS